MNPQNRKPQDVTILAYGPRKGGKTYTLFGRALRADSEERGLLVRFLQHTYEDAKQRSVIETD